MEDIEGAEAIHDITAALLLAGKRNLLNVSCCDPTVIKISYHWHLSFAASPAFAAVVCSPPDFMPSLLL